MDVVILPEIGILYVHGLLILVVFVTGRPMSERCSLIHPAMSTLLIVGRTQITRNEVGTQIYLNFLFVNNGLQLKT